MRIAVLNDIHGNLPALEAVLAELRETGVDRIVVGGDVFPGPMPHQVLDALLGAGVPVDFIHGNGEVAIVEQLSGEIPALVPEPFRPLIRWNAEQLDDAQCRFISGWPMTLRLEVPAIGEVLFCHATPRNPDEIFTVLTAEERLISIFESAHAGVVICGHTHMQFDRTVGNTRVINAGSVGMPFGVRGADWLMIDSPRIELRHTPYDADAATERILRSGYPGAEEFVTRYVLDTPSAADILKLYSQRELKA